MRAVVLATAVLAGCWTTPPDCERPEQILVRGEGEPVTCDEASAAIAWAEVLAARELTDGQQRSIMRAFKVTGDPAGVRAGLAAATAERERLEALKGLAAAEARSRAIFAQRGDGGPLPRPDWPDLASAVDQAVSVWSVDEEAGLVLTEMDVEGWLRLASLAREVQGAGPLMLSVADRVTVYRSVQDRWKPLPPKAKIAMVSVGPFWPTMQMRWASAPYERQQAWIDASPLPGPMTATSLGYFSEILDGDVAGYARALHEVFGPFQLTTAR